MVPYHQVDIDHEEGDRFEVAVDPRWPGAVVPTRGRSTLAGFDQWLTMALPFALIAVALGFRGWGALRQRRLNRGTGTTWSMLGAVEPSERSPTLHLWALDATPGSPSVASVPVLEAGPLTGAAPRPVEVRGRPGPGGRVTVRVDGEVLTVTRRCLLTSSTPLPAPTPTPLPRVFGPPGWPGAPWAPRPRRSAWARARSGWVPLRALLGALVVVVGAISGVVTLTTAQEDEAVISDGRLTTGVVRDTVDGLDVVVDLDDTDSPPRRRTFSPEVVEDYPIGERVLVWADDTGAKSVGMAPYDLGPTLLSCGAVVAAGLALVARTLMDRVNGRSPAGEAAEWVAPAPRRREATGWGPQAPPPGWPRPPSGWPPPPPGWQPPPPSIDPRSPHG